MRAMVRLACIGYLVTTGACFAYRSVAAAPAPGARVRIVFAGAIPITVLSPAPAGTRLTHPAVLEATGTIQAAAADTLALRLGELRTAAGPVPDLSGYVALLPTAQIARIEERKFQPVTTILTAGGVAAVALTAFLVVVLAAMMKGF